MYFFPIRAGRGRAGVGRDGKKDMKWCQGLASSGYYSSFRQLFFRLGVKSYVSFQTCAAGVLRVVLGRNCHLAPFLRIISLEQWSVAPKMQCKLSYSLFGTHCVCGGIYTVKHTADTPCAGRADMGSTA